MLLFFWSTTGFSLRVSHILANRIDSLFFMGAVSLFYVFFAVFVVFCSNVFLYASTGYISSFRDWMQPSYHVLTFFHVL